MTDEQPTEPTDADLRLKAEEIAGVDRAGLSEAEVAAKVRDFFKDFLKAHPLGTAQVRGIILQALDDLYRPTH